MMTKKLSHYDRMVLFNKVQVKCVKLFCEPRLVSLLLKEPRRNMTDDEHLVEGKETAANYSTNIKVLCRCLVALRCSWF